jgi:Putative zinc-finger
MTELPEMPCRELVEVITDYLEDALTERDRLRMEEHLAESDACRDYVEQFRQTIALAGRVEPEQLPDGMRSELLSAFRDWRADPPERVLVTRAASGRSAQVPEGVQERLASGRIGHGLRDLVQRPDQPAHVLQVAGAPFALGEMCLEADALSVRERALEVVRDELDELAADERIVVMAVATPDAHQRLTSMSGTRAARTLARAR